MPVVAMGPITVTVPIAAAGIEDADSQTGNADNGARPIAGTVVRATMAVGAAVGAGAAALGGVGDADGAEGQARGEGCEKDSFHVVFSSVDRRWI
jgi:hypothetical protein